MSARKLDLAVAAWERLQAADKAHSAAYDARDEAEAKAKASGGASLLLPSMRVGRYECLSLGEVRRRAKELPAPEGQALIAEMRGKIAAWTERRRQAGLAPLDAAESRAMREWRAAMQAMGTTRATTVGGVIAKLKVIEVEIRDGHTGFGEAIIASAIKDLARIGRRGR
jgi:hypothetical protein